MLRNLKELYQYRGLLWSLTQRELHARYRGSVLGFFWTFLNPMLLMLVYVLLFGVLMKNHIPHYPYFMFVGLLPWIWFSTSIGSGATTISDRRDLMKKVRFPAQVLPATVVTSNLINYLLSLPLMVGLGLLSHVYPTIHVLFFPLVVFVQLVFTMALAYLVSALNVAFRDLQHIVQNILTAWYFVTPVLYSVRIVPDRWWKPYYLYGNPLTVLMEAYQDIFYDHQMPNIIALAGVLVFSGMLLWIGALVFESRREEFAEIM